MHKTLLLSSLLLCSACSETPQQTNDAKKQMPLVTTLNNAKTSTKQALIPKSNSSKSGRDIYHHKCASCHGKHAEKKALNQSRIIAGWQIEETKIALDGYRNGSYGGSLKAIMQAQAKALKPQEVTAVATYIATL